GPRDLAYVLYTSGSTGVPKGVMVEQRSVLRLVCPATFADLGPDETVLQLAPLAFDASTLEVWGPLLNGGRLVVAPPGVLTPEEIGQVVARDGVTTLWLTAGLFNQAVDAGLPGLGGLRQLIVGGDTLSPPHVRRARELLPGTRLVNGYGPTETCTFACCHPIAEGDAARAIPIGLPIGGTTAHVLDEAGDLAPAGAAGELCVGGLGVARGYQGRPDLTAERFVPDPFAPGARLYRTGDLARRRADGVIEFRGRRDLQVKVRGFRIEPEEVEARLAEHPGVDAAVVTAVERGSGSRRLVAYVTGDWPGPRPLRAWLADRLPDHLVPSAFVHLDRLPLTPNGKVDRAALPAPESSPELDAPYAPPRTPAEEALAGIWADVLEVGRVGIDDNFFELGGDSILAVRAVSRANAAGLGLTTRELFQRQTVAQLAAVASAPVAEVEPPAPGALAGLDAAALARLAGGGPEVEDAYPLAPLQQGMLFESLADPGAGANCAQLGFALREDLDEAAFRRAWALLAERNPVLRTSVRWEDGGEPLQLVRRGVVPPLAVEDWRSRSSRDWMRQDREAGFALADGPLVRGAAIRLDEREWRIVLTFHHLLLDGWSAAALWEELTAAYAALRAGRTPDPEPRRRYRDFIAWLRTRDMEAAREHWRTVLSGFEPPTLLGVERPDAETADLEPGRRYGELDAEVTAGLRRAAARHRVTLNTVVQGAWALLLGRCAGERDVLFGTTTSGRPPELPGSDRMVGLFINTLPVRARLDPAAALPDWLRELQRRQAEDRRHEHAPLNKVHAWCGLPPGQPLFETLVVFENFPVAEGTRRQVAGVEVEDVRDVPPFPLTLTVEPGDRLGLYLGYWRQRFEDPVVERLAGCLESLLRQVAADPDRRLWEYELPSRDEERALRRWEGTGHAAACGRCVHELFEARAAAAPDRVAVARGAERLTYAEVDRRANGLAAALRRLGVGPETPVGLCAGRSPDLVPGLLGIWKAGGAVVPIEAGLPDARLGRLVEESGLRAVVVGRGAGGRRPGSTPTVRLEDVAPAPSRPRVPLAPDNLAWIVYTSGSTGAPKGR
ncbi:MAG: amino acid adenylation domain-containing protein, partial [Chloroflexi bacterium]